MEREKGRGFVPIIGTRGDRRMGERKMPFRIHFRELSDAYDLFIDDGVKKRFEKP